MKKGERIFCFVLFGLAVLFLLASLQVTPLSELTVTSDGAYPILISTLSLIFGLWMVLENRGKPEDSDEKFVLHPDILVMILLILLYAVSILILHYVLATLLFTVLSIAYLERKNWKTGLLVGFISTFWIVLVFKYLFRVILP